MTLKDDLSHEKFMREQFEQSVHNLLARAEAAEARAADAEIRAKSWHDSAMTLAEQRDDLRRQLEQAQSALRESLDGMNFFVGADCPLCGGEGSWTTEDNNPSMIPVQHKPRCPIVIATDALKAMTP